MRGSAARWLPTQCPKHLSTQWFCFPGAVVLALATSVLGTGLQEPPVFRTTAELVVVPAVVFSSDGGPVTDLTVDDFKITEDGEERPISVFSGPDSGPLEVVLVLDSSSSMTRLPAKEATTALLRSLHPGSCVLLLPFNHRVQKGVWGHPNDRWMGPAVAGLHLYGGTGLYDSLLAAFHLMRTRAGLQARAAGQSIAAGMSLGDLMRFRAPGVLLEPALQKPDGDCTVRRDPASSTDQPPSVRRAIVVVSDGRDNASEATIDDVLLSAWGSNLPVFAFAATQPPRFLEDGRESRTPAWLAHVRVLKRLAEYSGGIVISATVYQSGVQLLDGIERLGAALRSHYVLGYVPAKAAEVNATADRRSINVSVNRPGFDVLAPSDLMLGRGASEGAALDLALKGFNRLAAGETVSALERFDTASALGPGLGLTHFGRGQSLALLERPKEALAAFGAAEKLAPWLPDLDARMAELLVDVGDFDAAWERVLHAYTGGSEVLDLIDRLQVLSPRQVDLSLLPVGRRVTVRLSGKGSVVGRVAISSFLAGLVSGIHDSEHISFAASRNTPQNVLQVNVTRTRERSLSVVSVDMQVRLVTAGGRVMESPTGDKMLVRRLKLRDAGSAEEVRAHVAALVRELERLLGAH